MIFRVEYLDWASYGSINEHYLVEAESKQDAVEQVRELLELPIGWQNNYGNYLRVVETVDLSVLYMVWERND